MDQPVGRAEGSLVSPAAPSRWSAGCRKALELGPQRAATRSLLSLFLLALDRGEEALADASREPHEDYRHWALATRHSRSRSRNTPKIRPTRSPRSTRCRMRRSVRSSDWNARMRSGTGAHRDEDGSAPPLPLRRSALGTRRLRSSPRRRAPRIPDCTRPQPRYTQLLARRHSQVAKATVCKVFSPGLRRIWGRSSK